MNENPRGSWVILDIGGAKEPANVFGKTSSQSICGVQPQTLAPPPREKSHEEAAPKAGERDIL